MNPLFANPSNFSLFQFETNEDFALTKPVVETLELKPTSDLELPILDFDVPLMNPCFDEFMNTDLIKPEVHNLRDTT